MEFDTTELAPDTLRVVCRGRLDADGAGRAELPFTAGVASPGKHALVDLSAVSFVGSLGIRLLISAARVLHRRDRKMVLYGVSAPVAEVFATVALDQLIPIVATEAEARGLVGV